jgi:hypothetical protein
MKNTYSATIKMQNAEQLARFIEEIGPLVESVVITTTPVDRWAANPSPNRIINEPKTRPARGSKVNDTIVAALQNGPLTAKELKEALEHGGLAAGSLSTGLAMLQKSRVIERVGDGLYELASGYQRAAE